LPENNVARASKASAEVEAIFEDGTKTGGFDWLNDKDLFTGKDVFTGIGTAVPMAYQTSTASLTLPPFEAKPDPFLNAGAQNVTVPFTNPLLKPTFMAKSQVELDPFASVFTEPKFPPPIQVVSGRDSDIKLPDSDLFGVH